MLNGTTLTATATMLDRFDDSKRAVANLMAKENITVQIVDGTPTATFNPTTRVLTVPNWTGLTVEQADLLMVHEVGHALFTDSSIDLKSLKRGLFSYLNIVEDARIERRMKGAFPGTQPTFYKGYREFHANGPILKGTSDALINPKTGAATPVASMRLIDRINLHYKIGAFVRVPFTATERTWLTRIDRSTSTAECLQIARELYAAQKEQDNQDQDQDQPKGEKSKENKKNQPKSEETEQSESNDTDDQESSEGESQDGDDQDSDSDEADGDEAESGDDADDQDGDSADSDEDSDEDGEDSAKGENSDDSDDSTDGDDTDDEPTESESDPTADTDTMTKEALESIASKGQETGNRVHHLLYPVFTDEDLKGRVVAASEWAKGCIDALSTPSANADLDKLETSWNARFLATAKAMATEFERRKNAKQLQHATTAKSGKLDLGKLSQYRWSEDLFKRVTSVPNGKSHGIVMIIDGSGSMSSQFAAVIDQVLLFAQFAHQVSIPFEAYMFSDTHTTNRYTGKTEGMFEPKAHGLNQLALNSYGRLIGLVNTTADRAGFKKNVRALLAMREMYAREEVTISNETRGKFHYMPNCGLGGTPLFCGILIGERMLAKMKAAHRLDKTTFFVVTDGEDTSGLLYSTNQPKPTYGYGYGIPEGFATLTEPFVLRDAVSKRNLTFVNMTKDYRGRMIAELPENAIMTALLDMIKIRHDARTVYIYLQESRRMFSGGYRRRYGRRNNTPQVSVEGLNYMTRANKMGDATSLDRDAIKEAVKTDGQYVLPVGMGVADLSILLPSGSVELTEDAFRKLDTDGMTQKKIAQAFTAAMVTAVANRKFVNSVIPHLI